MTQPLTFVILTTGLDNFKELRNALSSDPRTKLLAGGDDADQLFEEIVRLRPLSAIVVMGANPDNSLSFISRIAKESPATAILSAAENPSPDLILRSMRAGARDFLRLPINNEEFKTVLDRTAHYCAGQVAAPKKKGRMIAVFSSKGGCGTSFLAANIAASTAAPAVLVDLNLQAGDLQLFLGVDPRYSIADLVEGRARLDDELIKSLVAPYSSNLSLIAAPKEADSADGIEPEHVFEVLSRLRECYEYVVLDPQHTFDPITLAALDQADDIVLVLTLDIPSIRSAQRTLEIFDRLGYPRKKVRVIVNRFSKQIDLDLQQVEKFLGEPVLGFIPSDYQTAVSSINLGQPLVQSGSSSRLAQELTSVVRTIIGSAANIPAEGSQRKRIWERLFGREAAKPEPKRALSPTPSLIPARRFGS
jgi:pilus assembly protein CpaE